MKPRGVVHSVIAGATERRAWKQYRDAMILYLLDEVQRWILVADRAFEGDLFAQSIRRARNIPTN